MESAVSNLGRSLSTVFSSTEFGAKKRFQKAFIRIRPPKAAGREGGDEIDPRMSSRAAPVGSWERFPTARAVKQMIETMERIMEDPYAYSGTSFPSLDGGDGGIGYRRGRTPWEIEEGPHKYDMRFDMPGMARDDVRIWVDGNMLVVKAEKEGQEKDESYGRYNSRILLPENVLVDEIESEVRDGVLYITIPKAPSVSDS